MKSVSSSGNGKALDFDEFLELIAYTHKVRVCSGVGVVGDSLGLS
jgi:hypothetical protein